MSTELNEEASVTVFEKLMKAFPHSQSIAFADFLEMSLRDGMSDEWTLEPKYDWVEILRSPVEGPAWRIALRRNSPLRRDKNILFSVQFEARGDSGDIDVPGFRSELIRWGDVRRIAITQGQLGFVVASQLQNLYLMTDDRGRVVVRNKGVSAVHVIETFLAYQVYSPEHFYLRVGGIDTLQPQAELVRIDEVLSTYDTQLMLPELYAVADYWHDNRAAVDAELRSREEYVQELEARARLTQPSRESLVARRGGGCS